VGVLSNTLRRLQFGENLLGIIVDPFFIARRGLFKSIQKSAINIRGDILDVGCGRKPYEHLFECSSYIGMEVLQDIKTTDTPDCFYDGMRFPFRDGCFDSVLCSQVLEHVFTPGIFLEEISRVLKNGGKVMISVPFAWNEHEQPYDYARYSSFGLAYLLSENGFELLVQDKSRSGLAVICQLANGYLHEVLRTRYRALNLMVHAIFTVPISLLGLIFEWLLPKSDSLYLDNVVVAVKKNSEQ
jgi:SAM-dependent methyltransferase